MKPRCRTPHGFTLLEMIIVIGLMAVLMGLAALSFASIENTDELTGPSDKLIRMAKQANRAAVVQGRPIVIGFDKTQFGFAGGEGGADGICQISKDMKVNWQRWNGGRKFSNATGLNWIFYPTGICDALRFQFVSSEGTVEVGFNPLTGSVTEQITYLNKKR
jgi:type II secretion system protein H